MGECIGGKQIAELIVNTGKRNRQNGKHRQADDYRKNGGNRDGNDRSPGDHAESRANCAMDPLKQPGPKREQRQYQPDDGDIYDQDALPKPPNDVLGAGYPRPTGR
jgi:hypothetical protein